MLSTAFRPLIASALLGTASAFVSAQPMPRILEDPMIGLRYEPAKIHFQPLPPNIVKNCPVLNDGGLRMGKYFIFAKAGDASGRTFYLLNGYEIRRRPGDPRFPQYIVDGIGLIMMVRAQECLIIDSEIPDRFLDKNFNEEYSEDIQQRLLFDFANRLSTAFGGMDKLRLEMLNQLVDLDTLPEVLRRAFRDLRLKK